MSAKSRIPTFSIVSCKSQMCQRLETIFSKANGFHLIGIYRDGTVALEKIPLSQPDFVIMNTHLATLSGLECLQRLKGKLTIRVIFIIAPRDIQLQTICEALHAGATGLLSLPLDVAECLAAAKHILDFCYFISPIIVRNMMPSSISDVGKRSPLPHFTATENKILQLASEGRLDKEIAAQLGISPQTVAWHFKNLFSKFGVHKRCAALTIWLNSASNVGMAPISSRPL